MSEAVFLVKIEEIGRKLDELMNLLKDVFLIVKEYMLLKETDEIIRNKRFCC
ncbi:MAG: hypothetical protein NDF51_01720 [archaeon YNP-WB-040]|nr:hypothetical protein [Candidatus Culexarchaeum yellowstonense]